MLIQGIHIYLRRFQHSWLKYSIRTEKKPIKPFIDWHKLSFLNGKQTKTN
jgi:hypothetical protein